MEKLKFVPLILCGLLGACASQVRPTPAPSPHEQLKMAAYNGAALEPVDGFSYTYLLSGERLDGHQIVVHTWPEKLWLVSVGDDCSGLSYAWTFGVTSSRRHVQVTHDRVLFDDGLRRQACRITEIRPIDPERLATM